MIFKKHKRVTENGLIALSGLCNGLGSRIKVEWFGNYIVWALDQKEDDECLRLACGLISDIASAIGELLTNYLSDFVPPLLNILKDQERDRMAKL